MDFAPFLALAANSDHNAPADTQLWSQACRQLEREIGELLAMDTEAFWACLLAHSPTLAALLRHLFALTKRPYDELLHRKVIDIDASLKRAIYALMTRILTLVAGERSDGMALSDSLLSVDILSEWLALFGAHNADRIKALMQQLCTAFPELIDRLDEVVETIGDHLHAVQKHYEKAAGKSKASSSPPLQSPDEVAAEYIASIVDAVTVLTQLLHKIPSLSTNTIDRWGIPGILADAYATLIPILDAKLSESTSLTLLDRIGMVKLCKLKMLESMQTLLKVEFYRHFSGPRSASSETDGGGIRLSGVLTALLDREDVLHQHYKALCNAPLLVDLDAVFGLRAELRRIISDGALSDATMLEHTLTLLDQLCANVDLSEVRALQAKPAEPATIAAPGPAKTQQAPDEAYIVRSSVISQVQDLFPDLGDGFIDACLIYYNDSVDAVVAALCEDALPAELAKLDRSIARLQNAPVNTESDKSLQANKSVPPPVPERPPAYEDAVKKQSSLLDQRANVYNGDEFDILRNPNAKLDASLVHQGKRGPKEATKLLDQKRPDLKQSILHYSETYNDEYDDTYDDQLMAPDGPPAADDDERQDKSRRDDDSSANHFSRLISLFISDPAAFNRDAATRRSAAREQLRQATQMSDEQLEGWKIMLDRHPRRQQLIDRHGLAENTNRQSFDSSAASSRSSVNDSQASLNNAAKPSQRSGGASGDRPPQRQNSNRGRQNRKQAHSRKMGRGMSRPDE